MTEQLRGSQIVSGWPDESKEAAQLVLEKYGEPDEATESFLVWHRAGPWKRIVASKTFWKHNFPAPHHDSIEGVLDFQVPPDKCTPLAEFDGSASWNARRARSRRAVTTRRRTTSR